MPLYQAIILAIVQGLTEFLPVSSTAHLALIPRLFGWTDPGLGFDVALHVGTLTAIFIFFFQDWVQIISNGLGFSYRGLKPDDNSRSLLWFLVSAIVGIIVIAFFLKYLRRHTLDLFIWYRVAFGIIIIALAVFFRSGG